MPARGAERAGGDQRDLGHRLQLWRGVAVDQCTFVVASGAAVVDGHHAKLGWRRRERRSGQADHERRMAHGREADGAEVGGGPRAVEQERRGRAGIVERSDVVEHRREVDDRSLEHGAIDEGQRRAGVDQRHDALDPSEPIAARGTEGGVGRRALLHEVVQEVVTAGARRAVSGFELGDSGHGGSFCPRRRLASRRADGRGARGTGS